MDLQPASSPFTRPIHEAAADPSYWAELEAYVAAVPINERPVNPDLGSHGCGGPEACTF
jgi:hypothetical protein